LLIGELACHRCSPAHAAESRTPPLPSRGACLQGSQADCARVDNRAGTAPPSSATPVRNGERAPPSSRRLWGEMLPASGMVAAVRARGLAVCALRRLCAHDARARVGSPWGASERGSSSALRTFRRYPDPRADRTGSRAAASDPRRCVCEPFVGHFPRSLVGDFEGLDEAPRRF
jgi:hypothetical protein